mgnify:CR=1 FL=1
MDVGDYKELAQANSNYNWEDTIVKFDYNTHSQYLVIEVELENINDYPALDYYAELNISEFDDEISSKLRYDSANERFYATYNIYVRYEDIEDQDKLTMFVTDEYDDLQHLLTDNFDVIFDR